MALGCLAWAPATGEANPKAKPAAQTVIDLRGDHVNYAVLGDGDGNIYVMRLVSAGAEGRELFVGDGKLMYRQRIISSGGNPTDGDLSWGAWSPRVTTGIGSVNRDANGVYELECGQDSSNEPIETRLTPLPPDAAAQILTTAQFRTEFWDRSAHFLARDAQGTYYFVDRQRGQGGGRTPRGHRVFVGKRGAMKQAPLTSVVDDSAGEIYATKRGELRLTSARDGAGRWTRGKKSTDLIGLPIDQNLYLIYRELGIYGHLGVLCEDL